ncbi:MAG: hypothetical protein D6775_04615 [Caldilineae bacterium]|nr:MAG: hypothetical protein D6775_04615 [Caldilineae bacterium]
MAKYQILYWYEIPTQVRAKEGRNRFSVPLSDRFMETVDKTAMAARITGSDAYMRGFKWSEAREREGTPEEVARAVAAELEQQYQRIPWRDLARRLREQAPAEG